MPQKKSENEMTYEKAMARIEEISSAMEDASLSIDAASVLFEEAVKLISFCNNKLKEVELKISEINETRDF